MRINMKNWVRQQIAAPVKRPMPLLSFPCVQMMDITVRTLISDSALQAAGLKMIADRIPAAASVSFMDLSVEAEAFGSAIRVSDHEVPTVTGAIVTDEDEADALEIPAVGAGRTGISIEAIRRAAAQITDRPVFAGVIGPYSLAGRLMDVSEAMIYCYDEPDMVHTVLEKVTEFLIRYCRAYKEAGANGVVIAEPLAGLLSPNLAREFSHPYVSRLIAAVQDDHFAVIYHNCGNNVPLMTGDIYQLGAMGYHFGDSISMAAVLPGAPADALIMGNVSPAAQFFGGTPASIRDSTLQVMGACCGWPSFVISSGCDVPPMASWDNIGAFFAAAAEFYAGKKPPMTNKERALRAIRGEATDRPSVLPSIDVAYAPGCIGRQIGECFRSPQLHAQALMGALDRHPEIDGLYVNLCLSDQHLTHQSGRLYNDGFGLQWYVPDNDIGTVRLHEITELEDPRIDADTSLCLGPLETFAAIEPKYKENYLIIPGITGPYSQLVFMMGLENVLLMMYDDPDGLKEAIGKRVKYAIKWLDELEKLGASAVWLGEGAASSSVISPAAYAEFVAPYAKVVIEEAKRRGIPCFMHVCGDIRLSIDEIRRTGLTAIDIDYMVPMDYAREKCGPDVCLKGNMNPISLFSESKETIFELSRQILTQTTGPVILGTGCLVAPNTPPENIDAMVAAAKSLV